VAAQYASDCVYVLDVYWKLRIVHPKISTHSNFFKSHFILRVFNYYVITALIVYMHCTYIYTLCLYLHYTTFTPPNLS